MHGFLLIDKPKGISSFDCVRALRKALNVRRMGFVGTLDPLATGLMIFAIGEATKLIPYLEGQDKVYEVVAMLGAISDTYDGDGHIEEMAGAVRPSRAQIEEVLHEKFLGERQQVPPAFSAVHVEGRRAYDLARRGETFDLKPRKVSFFELALKSYAWPRVRITVHCSSGAYVRSFVHDLGAEVGCGAYVEELRRTKIGSYSVKDAAVLEKVMDIRKPLILPQEMFRDWAQIEMDEEKFRTVWSGGFIENFADIQKGPALALHKGVCFGVVEVRRDGLLKLERRLNILNG